MRATGELTITDAFGAAAGTFEANLAQAFQGQAVGAVSGFLTGELAEALGLKGFGGGLFKAVTGSITTSVLNNAVRIATTAGTANAVPVTALFDNVLAAANDNTPFPAQSERAA